MGDLGGIFAVLASVTTGIEPGVDHLLTECRCARARGHLRLVTAHIGSGASLAAVVNGRSVDTTMGFAPMEDLVMAARSGSIDPGLILWVQRHGGLSPDEIGSILEHDSGLRGLTGRVGENAPRLRSDVGRGLGFLGVRILEAANGSAQGDAVASLRGAPSAVLVVAAREDLEIARHVRDLLQ